MLYKLGFIQNIRGKSVPTIKNIGPYLNPAKSGVF